MNFISDNAYGAAPEILAAVARANEGTAVSYGEDEWTARVVARLSEIFEREVAAFPVATGTAANALAIATLVPPYGAVFCHEESHLVVDECGAPEFFSGGAKLAPLPGEHGKISPETITSALTRYQGGVHSPKPSAVSITQATERGTIYRPAEIARIGELARQHGLSLHIDGARFANALAYAGCSPAELTWKSGVDVLSFGATKNGALCAEAVVFFKPESARDFDYRRKRGGHLLSKMRFISAQLEAYLEDDRWIRQARRANELAQRMAAGFRDLDGIEIVHPVEANEVFVRMPKRIVRKLRDAGAQFYEWIDDGSERTVTRLVLSFLTPETDIDNFLIALRSAL